MEFWRGRTAQCDIVEMDGGLDSLYFSADVVFLDFGSEVGNRWMSRVVSAKDLDSFFDKIGLINVLD